MDFRGVARAISKRGVEAATAVLGTGPVELWAVVSVETRGCGFLPDRRPQLLFERHVFHQLTGGRFDDGDISDPLRGGYGPTGAHQYDRLARAIALDRAAALQSASWGLGQIMGRNFSMAGFGDVESMVAAMCESEDAQLSAISTFIVKQSLQRSLISHDWAAFARRYNGPSYAENQYDAKLQRAFLSYSSGPLPDLDVRAAQLYLAYLGYDPGTIDGIAGHLTRVALMEFQHKEQIPQTGNLDVALLARLIGRLPT
jgi:N-acetylmuramidase-like protein/putative peptidoglycan binding protein